MLASAAAIRPTLVARRATCDGNGRAKSSADRRNTGAAGKSVTCVGRCLSFLAYLFALQVAIQRLQASIAQHSDKVNKVKLSTLADPNRLLSYAHKIAYTSFAPLGYKPGQALPPNARPPNPQDWQFRSSQLHQFQGDYQRAMPCRGAGLHMTSSCLVTMLLATPLHAADFCVGLQLSGMPSSRSHRCRLLHQRWWLLHRYRQA